MRLAKASATPTGDKITFAYLSRMVGEAVGDDAVIFNEYSLIQEQISREKPDTFYGLSAAGGLGWGFGAALGAKLAAPDKFVVATLGDGAYMFSNPMVAHWVSDVHKLPILTIVFNNSLYGAVRGATMSMFKDGVAGEDGGRFMADLSPSPAFEAAVKAQGGHGERVEKASELPAALARARDVVIKEKRQALLNVIFRAVGDDAVIFNEYSLIQEQCPREKPDTFYGLSAAGGLGWGFGAALGAKLAAPEKFVVATLGDGAYMFSNPMVAHWVSDVHKLPILTIVFNNSLYGAVRGATMSMFKDGVAGEDGGRFMADLSPSPAFEEAVKAQGGHGERVEKASELPAALARAIAVVTKEKRQALLNVICPP